MDPASQNQQYPLNPAPDAAYGQYGPPAGNAGGYPQQPMMAPQPQATVVKSNPNSTQNALQIAEIRDGIVIMNDGSFRSVVMVKSINFDLMSPQERESVEFSYQGFLNSLYFPIQIFIRSSRVDLRPYIEKLDKIRSEHENMLLALLMEDYITYIDQLSMQTNIMDKRFYIVIPYFPMADLQKAISQSKNFFSGLSGLFKHQEYHVIINEPDLAKAKDELRNRVQAVLGGMQQCGIQGLPLDTQELIELYYDSYNPDTATRQQLKNFDDLSAPIVTKGAGQAPTPNLDRELPG
jgi:type IV secretory pathway VirB4 component